MEMEQKFIKTQDDDQFTSHTCVCVMLRPASDGKKYLSKTFAASRNRTGVAGATIPCTTTILKQQLVIGFWKIYPRVQCVGEFLSIADIRINLK